MRIDLGYCNGKKCYSKRDAQTAKNFRLEEGTADQLRIYQCNFCNYWHLTHKEYIKGR